MLRDDQIVEILELVDFRISKSELSAFFRDEKHPNYVACGDQILRNFLNGLIIYLRGTKENPKIPKEVLAKTKKTSSFKSTTNTSKPKTDFKKKPTVHLKSKKTTPKIQVVEKVVFKNGKNKKS